MAGSKKLVKKPLKRLYFPLGRSIFGDVLSINGVSYLKLSVFKSPPSTKGGRRRVIPSSTFHLTRDEFRRLCLLQDRIVKQFSQLPTNLQLTKPRTNNAPEQRVDSGAPWWTQHQVQIASEPTWRNSDSDGGSASSHCEPATVEKCGPRSPPVKEGADQKLLPYHSVLHTADHAHILNKRVTKFFS